MICEKCGAENPDGAKFCHKCGYSLKSSQTVSVNTDNAEGLKDRWASLSGNQKLLALIVCCCVGWLVISSIMGALTPDKNSELFDDSNEGKDISLAKMSTNGSVIQSGGKNMYQYNLNGILKNIPADSYGFTLQGTFYKDGKIIDTDKKDLDYFEDYTEQSEVTSIVSMESDSYVKITDVKLVIKNPNGETVYSETFDFDMDEFDKSEMNNNVQFLADDNY